MRVWILLPFFLAAAAACPEGWIPFFMERGRCFQAFNTETTYQDAELHCKSLAPTGHLVTIPNPYDNQYIHSQSQKQYTQCKYWIGFNRIENGKDWRWFGDTSSSFTNWHYNFPLPQGEGADCAYFDASQKQPFWKNDQDCAWAHCFICEMTDGTHDDNK